MRRKPHRLTGAARSSRAAPVSRPGRRGPILEHPAAPYGATAITGPEGNRGLSAAEEDEARYLGRRVAEVATWLRDGRREGTPHLRERSMEEGQRYDPSA